VTDSEFAAPRGESSAYADKKNPPLVLGIAITAIVLGVIGVGQGLLGIVGAFTANMMAEAMVNDLPSRAQGPYMQLMDAQTTWMPLGLFAAVLSLAVSGFMVFAAVQTLVRREVGMLGIAAIAAAVVNVVNVLVQALVRLLTQAEWDAYFSAVAAGPAGEFAQTGGLVGLLCGYGFILAFAGFWVWAWTALNRYAEPVT